MQAFNADVQDRILALVKAILEQNAIAAEVDPESRLVDVGLTSMDMVNLMLGVEAEFDFTIPQSEITPENFQSIENAGSDDRQPAAARSGGLMFPQRGAPYPLWERVGESGAQRAVFPSPCASHTTPMPHPPPVPPPQGRRKRKDVFVAR